MSLQIWFDWLEAKLGCDILGYLITFKYGFRIDIEAKKTVHCLKCNILLGLFVLTVFYLWHEDERGDPVTLHTL